MLSRRSFYRKKKKKNEKYKKRQKRSKFYIFRNKVGLIKWRNVSQIFKAKPQSPRRVFSLQDFSQSQYFTIFKSREEI